MLRNQKAQSTVEYLVLVAAVIAVILAFAGSGGPFRTALNAALNSTTNSMGVMTNRLATSHREGG